MMVSSHPVQLSYGCVNGNPFSCDIANTAQDESLERCQTCNFPTTLAPKTKIKGKQETYELVSFVTTRGLGRIYRAVTQSDGRPFILKEYVLPRSVFHDTDIQHRKEAFLNNAGLQLADGRVEDYRLLTPITAISSRDLNQERCFIVYEGEVGARPSLKQMVGDFGILSPQQVKRILIQILQSLECLNTQKFKLPSGQILQGLSHGNIGLETILLSEVHGAKGVAFLCDFAVWEQFFHLPLSKPIEFSVQQDLVDLGYLGFDLLAAPLPSSSKKRRLDPAMPSNWQPIQPEFRDIILSLMGLRDRSFKSSSEALQAILALPPEIESVPLAIAPIPSEPIQPFWRRILTQWRWLLFIGLLFVGSILAYVFLSQAKSQQARRPLTICCIKDVVGIPTGQFRFIAEKNGAWDFVYQTPDLLSRDMTLQSLLAEQQPLINPWIYQALSSGDEVIQSINEEKIDFAITALPNSLGSNVTSQRIAFDGIAIFVAFNYSGRKNGLPHALKGVISFEQLRRLYTGGVTNWQEMGGPDLPVKLYIPQGSEAIRQFEQQVLQDDNSIKKFRTLLVQQESSETIKPLVNNRAQSLHLGETPVIEQRPTYELLRAVIRDFELTQNPIGSIGFDSISKVFGQCSVYPLALKTETQATVSPLLTIDQTPITPEFDLCNAKGSYQKNLKGFRDGTYPLAYPIVVTYPLDNRRPKVGQAFAALLKTDEAQQLLSKVGLVPLRSPAPP